MFQTEVRQEISEYKKVHKEKPFYESVERWTQYMEEDLAYNNMNEMINTVIVDVENGGKFSLDTVAKKIGLLKIKIETQKKKFKMQNYKIAKLKCFIIQVSIANMDLHFSETESSSTPPVHKTVKAAFSR